MSDTSGMMLDEIIRDIDRLEAEIKQLSRRQQQEQGVNSHLKETIAKEEKEIGRNREVISRTKEEIRQMEEREKYLREAVDNAQRSNAILADMEFQARSNLQAERNKTREFQDNLSSKLRKDEARIFGLLEERRKDPEFRRIEEAYAMLEKEKRKNQDLVNRINQLKQEKSLKARDQSKSISGSGDANNGRRTIFERRDLDNRTIRNTDETNKIGSGGNKETSGDIGYINRGGNMEAGEDGSYNGGRNDTVDTDPNAKKSSKVLKGINEDAIGGIDSPRNVVTTSMDEGLSGRNDDDTTGRNEDLREGHMDNTGQDKDTRDGDTSGRNYDPRERHEDAEIGGRLEDPREKVKEITEKKKEAGERRENYGERQEESRDRHSGRNIGSPRRLQEEDSAVDSEMNAGVPTEMEAADPSTTSKRAEVLEMEAESNGTSGREARRNMNIGDLDDSIVDPEEYPGLGRLRVDSSEDLFRKSTRDVSRESTRDMSRETPRDVSRESPRDVSRESLSAVSRESPRDVSRESPRAVSREFPRDVSRDFPMDVSWESNSTVLKQQAQRSNSAYQSDKSILGAVEPGRNLLTLKRSSKSSLPSASPTKQVRPAQAVHHSSPPRNRILFNPSYNTRSATYKNQDDSDGLITSMDNNFGDDARHLDLAPGFQTNNIEPPTPNTNQRNIKLGLSMLKRPSANIEQVYKKDDERYPAASPSQTEESPVLQAMASPRDKVGEHSEEEQNEPFASPARDQDMDQEETSITDEDSLDNKDILAPFDQDSASGHPSTGTSVQKNISARPDNRQVEQTTVEEVRKQDGGGSFVTKGGVTDAESQESIYPEEPQQAKQTLRVIPQDQSYTSQGPLDHQSFSRQGPPQFTKPHPRPGMTAAQTPQQPAVEEHHSSPTFKSPNMLKWKDNRPRLQSPDIRFKTERSRPTNDLVTDSYQGPGKSSYSVPVDNHHRRSEVERPIPEPKVQDVPRSTSVDNSQLKPPQVATGYADARAPASSGYAGQTDFRLYNDQFRGSSPRMKQSNETVSSTETNKTFRSPDPKNFGAEILRVQGAGSHRSLFGSASGSSGREGDSGRENDEKQGPGSPSEVDSNFGLGPDDVKSGGYGIFGNSFRGSSTGLFGTGSMSEFGGGGGSSLFGGGGSMTSMPGFGGGSSTALGGRGSMPGVFGGGSSNNLGGGSGSNLGGVSGSNLGGGSGSNLGAGGSSSDFGFNFTQDDAETKSEFAMFFGGEGAGDDDDSNKDSASPFPFNFGADEDEDDEGKGAFSFF